MNTRTQRFKNLNKEINNELKKQKKEKRSKKLYKMITILLIIITIIILYARFIEPYLFITHENKITSDVISSSYHGLKIVHFSDLHYGSAIKEKELKKIVLEINKLKPDIVIFTGDLIDDNYEEKNIDLTKITSYLKEIKTTYGKYAVIGNHDYNNSHYKNIMYDSDFKLLVNEYDIIYNSNNDPILIYGLDDIIFGNPTLDVLKDQNIKDINYKIILLHEPDYLDNIVYDYNVNLILAGHSHNKQVQIPLIKAFWLPPYAKNYYDYYYKINNVDIYISNGLGESELNIRLGSIPSINLYRITKP